MTTDDTWVRVRNVVHITSSSNDFDLLDIPLNDTLLRVHGSLSMIVEVAGGTSHAEILASYWSAGLYTTLTTGGTIIDPTNNPSDFAPPLQRWLWWEQMRPIPQPVPNAARPDTRQQWVYSPTIPLLDVKAQVKATTAVSLHLSVFRNHTPLGVKTTDLWYWFSMLRSGT